MRYSEEIIEEVRERNDIVDVIGQYVSLKKQGSNYFGLCPFHNEKSPSFSVSGAKQMFYCFGCGAGGNVFTFLMQYESLSFQEAVKELASRGGVALPREDDSESARRERDKREVLFAINKEAATYFYYQLRQENGKKGYAYLTGRALTDATLKHFGLGYAPISSNDLVRHLRSKGYADNQIIEAGLASHDEKMGTHDKFWNRVMFPIQNIGGRVIGFGGRVMGDGKPKYLNSPETDIFDKSHNLYGLNYARSARKGHLILCEGYMDVIAMHQAGFTQAVASLGTAFTQGQAQLIKRYVENVILSYDSDTAGVTAALRAIEICRQTGLRPKVLNLEPHKDPDEFIKAEGAEAFEKRLREAENAFFFEIRMLEDRYNQQDPEERTRFQKEVARRLCRFTEAAERENYIIATAQRYHMRDQDLRDLVVAAASTGGIVKPVRRPRSGIQSKKDQIDPAVKTQQLLLTWLTEEPGLYQTVHQYVTPEDFTDPLCRSVADRMFADLEKGAFTPARVISSFTEEEDQRRAAALFNTKLQQIETDKDREKALHDIVYDVKKAGYEQQVKESVKDAEAFKRTIEGKKLLEKLKTMRVIPIPANNKI